MDHARLISALTLESYATRTASKAVLPDLIRKLIVASCPDLARCDIQDADHINRSSLWPRAMRAISIPSVRASSVPFACRRR